MIPAYSGCRQLVVLGARKTTSTFCSHSMSRMCCTTVNKHKNFSFFKVYLGIKCSDKFGKEGTHHPGLLVGLVHDSEMCGMR